MTLPPDPFNGRISQDELATYDGNLLAPVIDTTKPLRRRNLKIPLSLIVAAAAGDDTPRKHMLYIHFDGGTAAIEAGEQADAYFAFPVTILQAVIIADQATTAVLDLWVKTTAPNDPPLVANSITASAPPTVTAADVSSDAALVGWTVDIPANSTMRVNVNNNDAAERILLALSVIETE